MKCLLKSRLLVAIGCAFAISSAAAAQLKVAALHPLLADLSRELGGAQVEVIDLIGPKGDPHHFEPTPEALRQADGATLYLASGMGLEGFLPGLRTILGQRAQILEVGATIPALESAHDHDHGDHDHDHDHGDHSLDPHWWHSIERFKRATEIVADEFIKRMPEHAEEIAVNRDRYLGELDELARECRLKLATVPRDDRKLATAHEAFNYFCAEFQFTPFPVQGLNREQMPAPKQLATIIRTLQTERVKAIFPERESNPKILATITGDTGIALADPLIADGTGGKSYIEMMRANVSAIAAALAD